MNNYDYIKYGIGIGTKTGHLDFGSLLFESGIDVSTTYGTVERVDASTFKGNMFSVGKEYTSNTIYAYIKDNYIDAYEVRIPKVDEHQKIELNIECTKPNTLGYMHITIEKGANVHIEEITSVQNLSGIIIDVVVEDGANCTYKTSLKGSKKANIFCVRTSYVQRDASINWFADHRNDIAFQKHSIVSELSAPGATANTYGVFTGTENQVVDLYTSSIQSASHTNSDIFVRGVLDDASSAVYRGLVQVNKGAYGCKGYQQEDTLLLSESASVSSVPDLEILNNDVQCSHGVTTTHIDDLKLFYLRSRGMTKADAEAQFITGFLKAVEEKVKHT